LLRSKDDDQQRQFSIIRRALAEPAEVVTGDKEGGSQGTEGKEHKRDRDCIETMLK
jgi:hypothetical protein